MDHQRPADVFIQLISQANDDHIFSRRDVDNLAVSALSIEIIRTIGVIDPPPVIFVVAAKVRPAAYGLPGARVGAEGLGRFAYPGFGQDLNAVPKPVVQKDQAEAGIINGRALIPLSIFSKPLSSLSRLHEAGNSAPIGFQNFSCKYSATCMPVARSRMIPSSRR